VTDMLEEAVGKLSENEKPVFHSDQGWQYRTRRLQNIFKKNGLTQSMSRKGNCLDKAVAENFFAILKTEMYPEQDFKNADELIKEIHDFSYDYNHKRIKLKLKGLSPVDYRKQAVIAA
jgi:putative transposase